MLRHGRPCDRGRCLVASGLRSRLRSCRGRGRGRACGIGTGRRITGLWSLRLLGRIGRGVGRGLCRGLRRPFRRRRQRPVLGGGLGKHRRLHGFGGGAVPPGPPRIGRDTAEDDQQAEAHKEGGRDLEPRVRVLRFIGWRPRTLLRSGPGHRRRTRDEHRGFIAPGIFGLGSRPGWARREYGGFVDWPLWRERPAWRRDDARREDRRFVGPPVGSPHVGKVGTLHRDRGLVVVSRSIRFRIFDPLEESSGERPGTRPAILGPLGEAPHQGLDHAVRHAPSGGHRDGVRNLLHQDIHRLGGLKWRAAGEQLISDDSERVDIDARVQFGAARLLGRHVGGGSGDETCLGEALRSLGHPGDAEVDQIDPARFVEEDVLRLDVAMNDALPVRVVEGFRHTLDDLHRPPRRQRLPARECREIPTTHETHRHPRHPSLDAVGKDRKNIWMLELRDHLRFTVEAFAEGPVGRELGGQDLESDVPVEVRLKGLVNRRHPAFTQASVDPISPEGRPDLCHLEPRSHRGWDVLNRSRVHRAAFSE